MHKIKWCNIKLLKILSKTAENIQILYQWQIYFRSYIDIEFQWLFDWSWIKFLMIGKKGIHFISMEWQACAERNIQNGTSKSISHTKSKRADAIDNSAHTN